MLNLRRAKFLLAVFVLLVASGCIPKMTHNLREISVKPTLPMPQNNRIPLKLGIFIPDDFKNYRFPIEQETFRGSIEVGKSITMPFYTVLSSLFESVVFLEDFSPGNPLNDPELNLVLFPKVENFQWRFISQGPLSQMEAKLTLNCEFYDPAGRLIHKVTESGVRSNSTMSMAFSGLNAVESAEMPTRQVFEDVLNGLSPKILADREKLESGSNKRAEK